MSISNETSTK